MQVWRFRNIQEGDRIVANRGTSEVVGIGTVTGPYFFVPDARHGHRLPVDWDDTGVRTIEKPSWRRTLLKLKQEEFEAIIRSPVVGPGPPGRNPPYPLRECARETGFDAAALERWVRAIHRKGQAILYGPPGTGKTFMAEHLAKHLVGGGDGFIELVQFHPAYAYEDFIQGIRPQARLDGGLEYPMVPGRFLDFCERARERKGWCVLIIDEINRADLARVFGELMYLLEYRSREVPLAGGGEKMFRIPQNIRLIGTMNTADRSIALVDHALRRRFAFFALYPNYEVLRGYHAETGFDVAPLVSLLQQLNTQIADRHYEVGISFFLTDSLPEELEDIWRMEIEPYLEEYFFDQQEKVEEFRWERIAGRFKDAK